MNNIFKNALYVDFTKFITTPLLWSWTTNEVLDPDRNKGQMFQKYVGCGLSTYSKLIDYINLDKYSQKKVVVLGGGKWPNLPPPPTFWWFFLLRIPWYGKIIDQNWKWSCYQSPLLPQPQLGQIRILMKCHSRGFMPPNHWMSFSSWNKVLMILNQRSGLPSLASKNW